MRQRIITGIIGIIPVILILISNSLTVRIAVGIVSLYALHEMYSAIGIRKNFLLYIAGMVLSIAFLCLGNITSVLFPSVIVLLTILLSNHKSISISDVSVALFMVLYIVYTMSHITLTRELEFGNIYIYVIFIGAFATDTFAYFTGVTIGKHKLCPEISPKKTIEGAVGGIVGVIICFLCIGLVVEHFSLANVNYYLLILLGLLCGVFSELGDLAASIIKRQINIKDYGKILPGHGGIMDRLDSIIFIAPIVYYFVKYFTVLS
ncbi:MAG: phosphatidate cytidylyltransferase [Clostridia bacterium]|nr:phosphatidate cytidylyltransferase [Clostridia bacterium]